MGCAKGTIKCLLYLFNLLIFIASLVLIIVGIVYLVDLQDITSQISESVTISNIFIIIVGAIIFVISFMGCCGAVKENKCLLQMYAIILIAILVIQIAVGIYAFLEVKDDDDLTKVVRTAVKNAFNHYADPISRDYLDTVQKYLKCCGVDGPSDWIKSFQDIPNSCCSYSQCDLSTSYSNGCVTTLFDFIKDSASTIGYVALLLCLVEFIPAVFALCLSGSS